MLDHSLVAAEEMPTIITTAGVAQQFSHSTYSAKALPTAEGIQCLLHAFALFCKSKFPERSLLRQRSTDAEGRQFDSLKKKQHFPCLSKIPTKLLSIKANRIH
jgi:hypothetical protein